MYHSREATDPRDKVYALLGMSSDDGAKTAMSADYTAPWGQVFRRCVHRFLSDQVSVDTWDDKEIAMIRGKGRILGEVYSVVRDDATAWEDVQTVDIAWREATSHPGAREKGASRWTLQSGAKPVKVGDAICLVQGASRPTVVRQRRDHWVIVRVAVQPPDGQAAVVRPESPSEPSRTRISPHNMLLVWDWAAKPQLGGYGKLLIRHPVANRPEWEACLDEAVRSQNVCIVSQDLTSYDTSIESLQRTMDLLEQAWWSVAASEPGCPSRIGLVARASVVVDRFREHDGGWTAICVAAAGGLEAVVKLLLHTGVRSGDKDGGLLTPQWLAAQNGHEAVRKLLLGTGEVGLGGGSNWTQDWAVGRAVVEGNGTVAKLLLDTGRVSPNATVGQEQDTLLGLAARDGNGAMTKLLLQKGADLELGNGEGLPPLHLAAEQGHNQVVDLLLERGANPHHYAGHSDLTALSIAAKKGHEAVVGLLLEKGADPRYVDREDDTPLGLAAEGGHESVVRLLLEKGVDLEHMGLRTTAPLMRAVMGGHEAVVKLLLERGADTNGYNEDGDTLLLSAVREGSEAVARLLLEKGADADYMSPLRLAAELGHEAIARLLIEKGANMDSVSWI